MLNNQKIREIMENLSQNIDFQQLTNKIEALKIEIENDKTTIEESEKACQKIREMYASGEFTKELLELSQKASKANNIDQLKRYEETLEADLMFVPTRFVLCEPGSTLDSPAGFHPDERVYVKPAGTVIFTDKLPKVSNLVYFDLQQA